MKILVAIPAYNESSAIGKVLRSLYYLKKKYNADILVIDDGSSDSTGKIALRQGSLVIRHPLNRGLGTALATGFRYASLYGYGHMVTCDADGQHSAEDVENIIQAVLNNKSLDVVIGVRIFGKMPWKRKIVNFFSNIFTGLVFGIWTNDSQSGLRAFSRRAIGKIRIRAQKMEVSSEIFCEVKRLGLNHAEVPVEAVYTEYSLKKGQPVMNAFNVAYKLFLRRFGWI